MGRSRRSIWPAARATASPSAYSSLSESAIRAPKMRSWSSTASMLRASVVPASPDGRAVASSTDRVSSRASRRARRWARAWASKPARPCAPVAPRGRSMSSRSRVKSASRRQLAATMRLPARSGWMRQMPTVSSTAQPPPIRKATKSMPASAGGRARSTASASTTVRTLPTAMARAPQTRAMALQKTMIPVAGSSSGRP